MRTSVVADQSWERDMQLVTAVIKPHSLDAVKEAVITNAIHGRVDDHKTRLGKMAAAP